MQIVFAILAGIIGVLIGGVINVLSDDLPARRNPQAPHYPDGTPRDPSAWLGITAFLTGQRDSRATSSEPDGSTSPARLRWRHPVVEIVTGVAFAVLAIAYYGDVRVWAYFGFVAIMILITVIDVEHRLILFNVIIPASAFALFIAAVAPDSQSDFKDYLLGAAVGFGMFFLLFLGGEVYVRIRGLNVVAFGFGDVMLAGLSGLILGWKAFLVASVLTILSGAAGSIIYMLGALIISRRSAWFKPLPYGPYIVFGTLMMLFARDEVREFLRMGYM